MEKTIKQLFTYQEFTDIETFATLKRNSGETLAVVIPTLNEERFIGVILSYIQQNLSAVVDELLVLDGGSCDKTVEICEGLGVRVEDARCGVGGDHWVNGKGLALWRAQFLTSSSLVVYVDADIENFDSRFILGVAGGLLSNPELGFVKSFYRRPFRSGDGTLQESGGGRVTEILARPLFSHFYPEAAKLVQPLSGEYGFRRDYIGSLRFYTGYGVETSLVLDFIQKYGWAKVGQVDLGERIHRNRSLADLGKMSYVILQTFIDFADKDDKVQKEQLAEGGYHYLNNGVMLETEGVQQQRLPLGKEVIWST